MGTPVRRAERSSPAAATLLRVLYLGLAAGCSDVPSQPPPPPIGVREAVIVLTVVTTGSAPDSNGYLLHLDVETPRRIDASTEMELTVEPRTHTLSLSDVAGNCSVAENNPRYVTVGSGGRIAVTFQVWCPRAGSLEISTTTSGVSPDPDGYVVSLDGAVKDTLGVQDQLLLDPVQPGLYLVRLSSVAGNCSVTGGSSHWASIAEGADVTVSFEVICAPRIDDTPGEKLVVQTADSDDPESSLYLINADGSGRQRLTDDLGYELAPEFSADGSRILFVRSVRDQSSLVILDRASRRETVLPTRGVDRAVWSPDGTRIAFVRGGHIFVMDSDGRGETQLTFDTGDRDPYWSPDGTRIAFTRGQYVFVMNADGSLPHRISNIMRAAGPWSPDGRHLAITELRQADCSYYYYYYSSCGDTPSDLLTLDVLTGEEKQLTQTPLQMEWSPAWATDGLSLFFVSAPNGNSDIFTVRLDGSPPVNLTNSAAREDQISVGYVRAAVSGSKGGRIRRP
jgi:WD40 repeat protein